MDWRHLPELIAAGDGVYSDTVPKDSVVVRLDADGSRCSCSRASVCAPRQAHDTHYNPSPGTP